MVTASVRGGDHGGLGSAKSIGFGRCLASGSRLSAMNGFSTKRHETHAMGVVIATARAVVATIAPEESGALASMHFKASAIPIGCSR